MIDHDAPSADPPEPEGSTYFYVFMLAFWPVTMVLGLIDFYVIEEHDLRLYTLVAGVLAGLIAAEAYRSKALREDQAS